MSDRVYKQIRTVVEMKSEFTGRTVPVCVLGTVVECYDDPMEAYAVDLSIPDPRQVSGYAYENVVLRPGQFEWLEDND